MFRDVFKNMLKVNFPIPYIKTQNNNKNNYSFSVNNTRLLSKPAQSDSVSFSGAYISMIKHKLGKCIYCGSTVFNDQELREIADNILNSSNKESQKHIDNVLNLLIQPDSKTKLAQDRRNAHESSIKFFSSLKEKLEKEPSTNTKDRITELINENDDAHYVLVENLYPLRATVDHIEPQRMKLANQDEEINLGECCKTCNGAIKNGFSFENFYSIYPSIKNHMPADKFEFAQKGLINLKVQSQPIADKWATVNNNLRIIEDTTFPEINSEEFKNLDLKKQLQIKDKIREQETKKSKLLIRRKETEQEIQKQIKNKKQNLEKTEQRLAKLKEQPWFNLLFKYKTLSDEVQQLKDGQEELQRFASKRTDYYKEVQKDKDKTEKELSRKIEKWQNKQDWYKRSGNKAASDEAEEIKIINLEKAALERSQERVEQARLAVEQVKDMQSKLNAVLSEKNKQLTELRKKITMPDDFNESMATLDHAMSYRQELQIKINRINTDIARKESLAVEERKYRAQAQELKNQIIKETELANYHEGYVALNKANSIIMSTLTDLADKEDALSKIDSTNSQITGMQNLINDMRNKLMNSISDSKNELNTLAESEKIYKNNCALKEQIKQLEKKADEVQSKNNYIVIDEAQLKELQSELETLQKEKSDKDLLDQYSLLKVKKNEATSQLKVLDIIKEINQLKAEIFHMEAIYEKFK